MNAATPRRFVKTSRILLKIWNRNGVVNFRAASTNEAVCFVHDSPRRTYEPENHYERFSVNILLSRIAEKKRANGSLIVYIRTRYIIHTVCSLMNAIGTHSQWNKSTKAGKLLTVLCYSNYSFPGVENYTKHISTTSMIGTNCTIRPLS